MKIMISTDYHLSNRLYGLEELEKDNYKRYNRLIQQAVKEKPDIFIQLGDIFDTPYPKPISIKTFEDGLDKLQQHNIKCYGIMGNHTTLQRKNFYPIDKIFNDKMTLISNSAITIGDICIAGADYHTKTNDIKPLIDELYEKSKGSRLKILLLHQGLKKDINIGYDYDEGELGLDRFDYVLLGHFHKKIHRQSNGTTYHYPGSLNSCNISEMKEEMLWGRGYSILDTDTCQLTTHTIEPERQYIEYNITYDELNDDFIAEAIKSLKTLSSKPVIQLNITGNGTSNIHQTVQELGNYALSVRYKLTRTETDEISMPEVSGIANIEEMLKMSLEEEWQGNLAVELFRALSIGDIESASAIAEKVYKEQYET